MSELYIKDDSERLPIIDPILLAQRAVGELETAGNSGGIIDREVVRSLRRDLGALLLSRGDGISFQPGESENI